MRGTLVHRAWIVLALFAFSGFIGAPALAQTQIVSLNDAIQIALERNATLRAAQIDAKEGELEVDEARMQFVPDLVAGTTGMRTYGRSFNETEGRIVEQTTQSLSLGVSSGVTLFNGFRDVANLSRANFYSKASKLDLERTTQTVVFTVASNFLTLVNWQELSRVQRENLAAEVELEQQLQHYVAAGARAAADLYQQQAIVAAARGKLIEAQSAAELAQVELMRTLQLDPAGTYDFQPPVARDEVTESIELQDLLSRVFANRTDLHAQEARFKAAEQELRMANAGYWPTLSLVAGYGSAYTDASTLGFNDQLDAQRGGSVSLNLTIPIFDRNNARYASRRARLQLLSEEVALTEAHQQIGLQVRQAYMDYQSARKRFAAAEAQQHAASRSLQTAQERFRSGASTLVELSQARSYFLEAEAALATARIILSFQRTAIDYFMGELDPNRFNAE